MRKLKPTGTTGMKQRDKAKLEVWFEPEQLAKLKALADDKKCPLATLARAILNEVAAGSQAAREFVRSLRVYK